MALDRSQQMARIRGRDTAPELLLRRALWAAGHRYRISARTPVGRPDVVFPRRRIAVFVDGCEWHGCPEHYVRPRSNTAFWDAKLAENTDRDRRQTLALEAAGWCVHRFWEHEVHERLEACVDAVARSLSTTSVAPPALHYRVVRVEPLEASEQECRYLSELRDAAAPRVVERARSTRKWTKRRPNTP